MDVVGAFRDVPALPVPGQIALRAFGIGVACGAGLVVSFTSDEHWPFGAYLAALAFFHWSEYMTTALFNLQKLSLDSFLLNHSFEYKAAAVFCCTEYAIESLFFPTWKHHPWVSAVGLAVVLFGEFVRKLAMFTARSNFSHIIADDKRKGHELVTIGIYGRLRHPSYFGWFWWSIGTQILLCNPVSLVGFAVASWRFFRERIAYEEETLIEFFGDSYKTYRSKVGTGIPYIS